MTDQPKQDQRAPESKGVTESKSVNEQIVERHPEFDKASDHPHPNAHIAGQTPAAETDQPTIGKGDELSRAVADAERALRAGMHYEGGVPSTSPEHLDPVIEALESALKTARAARKQ